MPKRMEEALKREAAKRGYTGQRADKFVYGTMRKTGWKPSGQKKATKHGHGHGHGPGHKRMAAFAGGGP